MIKKITLVIIMVIMEIMVINKIIINLIIDTIIKIKMINKFTMIISEIKYHHDYHNYID